LIIREGIFSLQRSVLEMGKSVQTQSFGQILGDSRICLHHRRNGTIP
jgi:hypothetical protein